MPPELAPETPKTTAAAKTPSIDGSLLALVTNWRVVVRELALRGVNLYDVDVRAQPWPGVRELIFALIDSPGTALRAALTRR